MPLPLSTITYHNASTNATLSPNATSIASSTATATTQTARAMGHEETKFTYTFDNFFHPFVGELITKLNRDALSGMLDPNWLKGLMTSFFNALYQPQTTDVTAVVSYPKEIDLSSHGPYANYNWELLFHVPMTIATHLSKARRFAEAQKWFHFIFNPLSTEENISVPDKYWRFLGFRTGVSPQQIDYLLALLSADPTLLSDENKLRREDVLNGFAAILNKPFQPHAVARTRHIAYQYNVVMRYLDNLIAWGDHLFQQDTIESINEATQHYILAANILGPRPQRVPARGVTQAKSYAQLRALPNDPMGNAMVRLEGQFPFNISPTIGSGSSAGAGSLFGVGSTLYFCIPRNDKMLGYWDIVSDRLFKIRHCMNLQGVVRQLALFDPPIDPGMLVKAAAAGIDIGSIVNGLNQPIGPVRSLALIQKASELASEVRSLGGALLSAVEKGEAEHLTLMRQRHDIQIQQLSQEVRFLQWQSARESTQSLLTARKTALERLHYYQRVLGLPADANAPDSISLDRRDLTEENFDEAYGTLVAQYDKPLTLQKLANLTIAGGSSPSNQSGATSGGGLYMNRNENADLNIHSPEAAKLHAVSTGVRAAVPILNLIGQFDIHFSFWGIGGSYRFGGRELSGAASAASDIIEMASGLETHKATSASKTGSFERRADDWMLQYNLAAHELMQNGRQILTSLIGEQIAYREYQNTKQQIANAQEVERYMHEKYTNEELYLWMQGEVSRLYYEYYRFAFDTARKAEKTMKAELMRPELDQQDFIKFNYWDGGRKGFLSGEALHLDIKRMEMAYHENNKRELEITRHVSLRQLDPYALMMLRATGSCQVTVPEWLYDRDCPGHYMRRIKSVAISIPSVVGPYTNINCTLSLLRSSIRKSPTAAVGDYQRRSTSDDRFIDYGGAIQSVVTSSGNNDSGMFETNLRDERFLPFEGAGAISTWKLDLPARHRAFNYATISDVILHIRYTARQGVNPVSVTGALDELFTSTPATSGASPFALLFSLRHDFPTEWAAFTNNPTAGFSATIRQDHFPYFVQDSNLAITGLDLYNGDASEHQAVSSITPEAASTDINGHDAFTVSAAAGSVMVAGSNTDAFLLIRYALE